MSASERRKPVEWWLIATAVLPVPIIAGVISLTGVAEPDWRALLSVTVGFVLGARLR